MSKTFKRGAKTVRALVGCALLTALAVVLARFLSFAPNETTRYSLETLPILLSGLLFGPAAGAMVGFASDFLGCLFSPYGYNPLLCLPPLLLGLWAGLWRGRLRRDWLRTAVALLPPMAFGYVLIQSAALAFAYHADAFAPFFAANLAARGVQYALIAAVDLVLASLLYPVAARQLDGK